MAITSGTLSSEPMKKEVVLAIIIGFGLGLLITFGIYTARTALQNQPSPTPSPLVSPEATGAALTVSYPPDEALLDTEKITLEGKTVPHSTVAIVATAGEYLATADEEGNFSVDIELDGGANRIDITSFTPDGSTATLTLTVVYSTAKI